MPPDAALHIPRCRSVHTFTMRFPLDLIWLDRAGRMVRVDRAVPPRRLKTCVRARSVVEANAGTADAFLAAGLAEPERGQPSAIAAAPATTATAPAIRRPGARSRPSATAATVAITTLVSRSAATGAASASSSAPSVSA